MRRLLRNNFIFQERTQIILVGVGVVKSLQVKLSHLIRVKNVLQSAGETCLQRRLHTRRTNPARNRLRVRAVFDCRVGQRLNRCAQAVIIVFIGGRINGQ